MRIFQTLNSMKLLPLVGRCGLVALISFTTQIAAQSRSQWEIQHPSLPADQDGTYLPGQMPGQLHNGVPPQVNKNFWQSGVAGGVPNRLNPGTVLSGVLENDITSAKNNPGDVFAITLQEGFVQNGMQVIPQNSRIVGAVTAVVSAKLQRHGQPGNIQVSLQSLVLPDGTHLPFTGFIAGNPNHSYAKPPKQRSLGFDMKDTGAAMAGMMNNYTNGIGYFVSKRHRGNEFKLAKGDQVPVRLNQALVIPEQEVKPVPVAVNQVPGLPPGATPGLTPGFSPGLAAGGLAPPAGLSPQMVPGLAGADTIGQYRAPQGARPIPGLTDGGDPFNAPISPGGQSRPLNQMAEPF